MTIRQNRVLVVLPDIRVGQLIDRVLKLSGYDALLCRDKTSAQKVFMTSPPDLVILAEKIGDSGGLEFGADLLLARPVLPLVLFVDQETPDVLKKALHYGFADVLSLPLRSEYFIKTINNILSTSTRRKECILVEAKHTTGDLLRRLDEMETLARLERSITSSLDLDSVLSIVVDSAVSMTNAEEGSLMLLDEESEELYVRAARNFPNEFIRTFRMPVKDTIAGTVLKSGKPFLLDENTPQKIRTSYLVYSLIYVPLQIRGHSLGILSVDNRQRKSSFSNRDISLLSALAEYTVTAIENARLFSSTLQEQKRLETLLESIQDGMMMLDTELRLVMINQAAASIFHFKQSVVNLYFADVFHQPELITLVNAAASGGRQATELTVDGLVFSAKIMPVPQIGWAISLHDITSLKKLDQIKSEFVSTVSHDLRSPLTAIMGYVELLDRAGPVNDMQRDFIRRVQVSVHNITSLVDDLLNLGRIEAGLDTFRENIIVNQMLHALIDDVTPKLNDKALSPKLHLCKEPLEIFANPVQIRQVFFNLIENAIKYTPAGGEIKLFSGLESDQVIVAIADTGIGIPASDLPHVFEKFFRASNIESTVVGTGLGLSIVRTVVEHHGGRVWVDSIPEKGSTFTLLFPRVNPK